MFKLTPAQQLHRRRILADAAETAAYERTLQAAIDEASCWICDGTGINRRDFCDCDFGDAAAAEMMGTTPPITNQTQPCSVQY